MNAEFNFDGERELKVQNFIHNMREADKLLDWCCFNFWRHSHEKGNFLVEKITLKKRWNFLWGQLIRCETIRIFDCYVSSIIKEQRANINFSCLGCQMQWCLLILWVICLGFIVLLLSFSFLVTHSLMWSWNELCESVVWISLSFFFLFLFWLLTN